MTVSPSIFIVRFASFFGETKPLAFRKLVLSPANLSSILTDFLFSILYIFLFISFAWIFWALIGAFLGVFGPLAYFTMRSYSLLMRTCFKISARFLSIN